MFIIHGCCIHVADQPSLALASIVKHLTFVPLVLLGMRNNRVSPFNQMAFPQIAIKDRCKIPTPFSPSTKSRNWQFGQ